MRPILFFSTLPLALATASPVLAEKEAAEKPALPPRPVAAAPT